ncbi:MAG TPA: 50S ribosomal protein L29 [Nitrospinota bacterium]|nr:50S ribosomal protein L29 [Nitrospinota bacterium]
MKFSEIKELTEEELARKLEDLKEGYMKLRFQHATGQLDSSAKMKVARRDVARVNTAFRQKKAEEKKSSQENN